MQQVEMKTKGDMVVIMWFSFAGSLSSSCSGFMASAIPIRYGCATIELFCLYNPSLIDQTAWLCVLVNFRLFLRGHLS